METDTPQSNYFSSPSPSPSPSPDYSQTTHEWPRDDSPENDGPGLYDLVSDVELPDIATLPFPRTPSPSPSPSPNYIPRVWRKEFASCGVKMYHPTNDADIPDMESLSLSDNEEEEDSFHSPPPPPPTQMTPHQTRAEKRFKKMSDICTETLPHYPALCWMLLGVEIRKNPIVQILRTGFNLKPSLAEVFEIESQLTAEFNEVMRLCDRNFGRNTYELCFITLMRDLMEIPDLAMIRMRRVLAECKCCEIHQLRRPLCQEKKRQPGYDEFAQPENVCKCTCRRFMRELESAMLGEHQLKINGQLWERSL